MKFSIDERRRGISDARDEGRLFFLSRDAAIEILEAFIAGHVDEDGVSEWAELFDVNEDVILDSRDLLANIVFELSSPEINGCLEKDRAMEIISILKTKE